MPIRFLLRPFMHDVIILVHFTSLHKVHLAEISFMHEGKNFLLIDVFWSTKYSLWPLKAGYFLVRYGHQLVFQNMATSLS